MRRRLSAPSCAPHLPCSDVTDHAPIVAPAATTATSYEASTGSVTDLVADFGCEDEADVMFDTTSPGESTSAVVRDGSRVATPCALE